MSVLTDPGWVVPPLPAGDGGGMDRLRRAVCRFSAGAVHAQRRADVERALAAVEPSALRAAARDLTLADPSPPLVPRVPLTVLAAALGVDDPAAIADLVPPVARGYLPGSAPLGSAPPAAAEGSAPGRWGPSAFAGPVPPGASLSSGGPGRAADAAADELLERVGVVRATLLVQSCLPVAALVSSALERGVGLDDVLASEAPPVPATRRWSPDTGEIVTVPLTGTPFGEGPRRCPAEPHALALAEGVLDALRPD